MAPEERVTSLTDPHESNEPDTTPEAEATDQLVRRHVTAVVRRLRNLEEDMGRRIGRYTAQGMEIVDSDTTHGPNQVLLHDVQHETFTAHPQPVTEGLPASLCRVLNEWVEEVATPEELADFLSGTAR